MLTVAILGLLIAIVAPRIFLDKTKIKTVSQETAALFTYAKEQSIAQQKEITVSLNIQAGKLSRVSVIDFGVGTGNILEVYIPQDAAVVSFNPNIIAIIFSPTQPIKVKSSSATFYPDQPITITFSPESAPRPHLILFPNTGRIVRQE